MILLTVKNPTPHFCAPFGTSWHASKSFGQNYASAFNRFTVSYVAKFCDSEQRFARKEKKNSISAMLAAAPSRGKRPKKVPNLKLLSVCVTEAGQKYYSAVRLSQSGQAKGTIL